MHHRSNTKKVKVASLMVVIFKRRRRYIKRCPKCTEIKKNSNKPKFTHGPKKKNYGLGSTWIKHTSDMGSFFILVVVQSAGAAEYNDCISQRVS